MLWYNAGAGTWYMGGKAALGQRKGILKAHDLAAAPELIKPGMWQLCLLYTSPSPRDEVLSRMPSSA